MALTETQFVFLKINVPGNVVRLWLISRTLKKLVLTTFANILIVLMEDWIFRGPYSILLEVLSPPTEILKLKNLKYAAQTKEPVD